MTRILNRVISCTSGPLIISPPPISKLDPPSHPSSIQFPFNFAILLAVKNDKVGMYDSWYPPQQSQQNV